MRSRSRYLSLRVRRQRAGKRIGVSSAQTFAFADDPIFVVRFEIVAAIGGQQIRGDSRAQHCLERADVDRTRRVRIPSQAGFGRFDPLHAFDLGKCLDDSVQMPAQIGSRIVLFVFGP